MARKSQVSNEIRSLADLTPDPKNARKHTPRNVGMIAASEQMTMTRRPRRNHGPAFKAKVAVAAIKGERSLIELALDFDVHPKRAARTRAETPALLKGLLFGPDGAAFSPTHTRKGGRLYRYYVSQTVLKHGAGACPVGRVPAGEIEAAVIDQLRAVFRQPEIVAGTWKASRVHADDITEADARVVVSPNGKAP